MIEVPGVTHLRISLSSAPAVKAGDIRFLLVDFDGGYPLFISAPGKNEHGDAVLYGPATLPNGKAGVSLGVWIARLVHEESGAVKVSKLVDELDIRLALHILNHPELEPMIGEV
jgi:hypothetical protein